MILTNMSNSYSTLHGGHGCCMDSQERNGPSLRLKDTWKLGHCDTSDRIMHYCGFTCFSCFMQQISSHNMITATWKYTLKINQQELILTHHAVHLFIVFLRLTFKPCLGWRRPKTFQGHPSSCSWTPFENNIETRKTPRRWPIWKMCKTWKIWKQGNTHSQVVRR